MTWQGLLANDTLLAVAKTDHQFPEKPLKGKHCCPNHEQELTMSDLILRNSILDELEFVPEIDAAEIGVTVHQGIVTLTGNVKNYAQKIAAERAVKAVKGVRAVAEEIQVKLVPGAGHDDETIASRVLELVTWNVEIPEGDIQVMVQHGWVSLEGKVDWQYQRDAVEHAVSKLAGVVGIHNKISLKPHLKVLDIQRRIEEAFQRNGELCAQDIRVKVDGDVVKLQGKVHLWHERAVAERAAWSVPGVRQVEDQLLIA
ncbi:osmotically-inducible protein OsmY [Pseudomonas sp. TE3610]